MATCAHGPCTCTTEAGSDYCSAWCQQAGAAGECHCHHAGCEAPHHH
jgi:hypothetical protein